MAAVASSRWMLHIGGGGGDPPHCVKCFECPEKRYINVHNAYPGDVELIRKSQHIVFADQSEPLRVQRNSFNPRAL